jgi:hypothetical protein
VTRIRKPLHRPRLPLLLLAIVGYSVVSVVFSFGVWSFVMLAVIYTGWRVFDRLARRTQSFTLLGDLCFVLAFWILAVFDLVGINEGWGFVGLAAALSISLADKARIQGGREAIGMPPSDSPLASRRLHVVGYALLLVSLGIGVVVSALAIHNGYVLGGLAIAAIAAWILLRSSRSSACSRIGFRVRTARGCRALSPPLRHRGTAASGPPV